MQKKHMFLNNIIPFYRFFLRFIPCQDYFYAIMLKSVFFSFLNEKERG
jgi:hypothetical protein